MASEAHRITLDPADGSPPDLPAAPESGLVLAYVPESSGDVCALHLLEFAHRWRDEGHRVVLADGCLETPILHEAAGVENGEGLSDHILYGTTLGRVTAGIDDDLVVVPAGTVVADPGRVLEHPRWTTLVSGFGEAGDLLLVAVPEGAGAARLEGLAARVVRFESRAEAAADVEAVPAVPVDPATPSPDAVAAAGSAGPEAPAEPEVARPERPRVRTSSREEPRSRTGVLLLLLLVVVLGAAGAAYLGWVEIPGITQVDVAPAADLLPLR